MSTPDRAADEGPGPLERAGGHTVVLSGLGEHAEVLALERRDGTVDRRVAAASRGPPVASSQWLVLAVSSGILAIPPLVGAWLGLRVTRAADPETVAELAVLSTLPLVVVFLLHLLTPLPGAFVRAIIRKH